MIERGALGFAQVVEDRGGGAGGQRSVFQAAAIEREQMEMIAQAARGVIGAEDPGFDVGFQAGQLRNRGACRAPALRGRSEFRAPAESRRGRFRWRGIRRWRRRRARGRLAWNRGMTAAR